jgi:hypothetical protein
MGFRKAVICCMLFASCAQAMADPPSVASHTGPSEARRTLKSMLQKMYRGDFNEGWRFRNMDAFTTYPVRNIKIRRGGFAFDYEANVVTSKLWNTRETLASHIEVRYKESPPISVSDDHPGIPEGAWYAGPPDTQFLCTRKCGNFFWMERADAQRFADAFNVLLAAAKEDAGDGLAEFRTLASAWRALPRKPPLSEEAERQRILAEHALQQNDLAAAAEHYDEALEGFPGWPEGWMNAALLCEALKDYDCAADRMRHYLELMPDSREAGPAREKVVVWDTMAARERRGP